VLRIGGLRTGVSMAIISEKVRGDDTITYLVFYHDLLITKLHHIDYKIILMAYMVQKIGFMLPDNIMKGEDEATMSPMSKST
jgi:hypothetical protein